MRVAARLCKRRRRQRRRLLPQRPPLLPPLPPLPLPAAQPSPTPRSRATPSVSSSPSRVRVVCLPLHASVPPLVTPARCRSVLHSQPTVHSLPQAAALALHTAAASHHSNQHRYHSLPADVSILVDPWLVGKLTFGGLHAIYAGSKREAWETGAPGCAACAGGRRLPRLRLRLSLPCKQMVSSGPLASSSEPAGRSCG